LYFKPLFFSYFYGFIGCLCAFSLLIFSCSISLLSIKLNPQERDIKELDEAFKVVLKEYPLVLFLGIYAFLFFLFSGALFVYHTYLIFTNQTTNEQIKKMWKLKSGNPYKKYVFYLLFN